MALQACRPDVKENKGRYTYFDLKGFIRADSARLNSINPMVSKTVNHNGESETRKLKITNWGHELGLFAASDINKPSWRSSYTVLRKGDSTVYIAKTQDLKTRKLVIAQIKSKVVYIHIFNHTKNILYETAENLTYTPDSTYTIDKTQHVTLLGSNRYIIKGKILR